MSRFSAPSFILTAIVVSTLGLVTANAQRWEPSQDPTPDPGDTATPTATNTASATSMPTATDTAVPTAVGPSPTPTVSSKAIYLPYAFKATGYAKPATFRSSCARIDHDPMTGLPAVCALSECRPDGTGGDPDFPDLACREGAPCLVEVSVPLVCNYGPPGTVRLVLEPHPDHMHRTATTVTLSGSISHGAAQFSIPSNVLVPSTVYAVSVVFDCGGATVSQVVGHIGLCDPVGHIIWSDGRATPSPVATAEVWLYHIPKMTPDPESAVSPTPGNCPNPVTRGTAAPAPGAGGPYWNMWSGEPTPPSLPAGAMPASVPNNPQFSDSTGMFGWLAPQGCYLVVVDPGASTAPFLPTALSPIVGEVKSISPAYLVDDLDLSYIY